MKKIIIILISSIAFFSCKNAEESQSSVPINSAPAPSIYDAQQEEITRQRLKQAYEDSLAAAVKAAQIAEDRALKYKKLASFANSFTDKYAKNNSPVSHENVACELLDSTYNELTGTATIRFRSTWDAHIYGIFDKAAKPHIYTGELNLSGATGEITIATISKNDNLKESDDFQQTLEKSFKESFKKTQEQESE